VYSCALFAAGRPPNSTLFPYTTLFRSGLEIVGSGLGSNSRESIIDATAALFAAIGAAKFDISVISRPLADVERAWQIKTSDRIRSEEHTSELQSPDHLVCRLLLEKKKN